MDKACIDTKIKIGIFRDLYKQKLLTKAQLDMAIEIVTKKEAKNNAPAKSSGLLPR